MTIKHTGTRTGTRSRMRAWQALLVLPLATAGLTLAGTGTAHADDRICRGTIGARTIDDNVVVPRGAVCKLVGTRVEGNVLVRSGAVLQARAVRVDGNIQAKYAKRIAVLPYDGRRSVVKGNIQLESGRDGGRILGVVVDGDIQLFSNRGRFEVRRNFVDGNLQCKNNVPRPVGSGNRVEGNKEGQCRGM